MTEEKKESYKSYSFRLNDKTYNLLKEMKNFRGKSWNLFVYEVLREFVNMSHNKNYYRPIFAEIYREEQGIKCNKCCSITNLCVHHKDNDITNNKKENLETLCRSCHGKQ